MTAPFDYPSTTHVRRHGPAAYSDHASYRPWLRDEFSFRCVYRLLREQWGRAAGVFDIDHFMPVANRPELALDYDNLLYACTTCNIAKRDLEIPDPLTVLAGAHVSENGRLHASHVDAQALIEILGLDNDEAVEFRMTWIGIVALAANSNPELYRKLMCFPEDLPDLERLKPPGGNTRPDGVNMCWYARRNRGELPETY